MRPHDLSRAPLRDDPAAQTCDERLREVASILAAGVLRLRCRAALPADPLTPHPLSKGEGRGEGGPKNLPESGQDRLEVPAETVLSVHTG